MGTRWAQSGKGGSTASQQAVKGGKTYEKDTPVTKLCLFMHQ